MVADELKFRIQHGIRVTASPWDSEDPVCISDFIGGADVLSALDCVINLYTRGVRGC